MARQRTILAWLVGTLCLLTAMRTDAAILVGYDLTGQPGSQVSNAATTTAPGVVADLLNRGPGIAPSAGMNSINSSGFSTAAIDLADYYEFGILSSASPLNLTSLEFTERRSGTGIRTIELRSSLDAFASTITTIGVLDNDFNLRQVISLGAPFQGLSAVAFRLYGYDAEASVGTWRIGIDSSSTGSALPPNLQLIGEVAPEPATLAMWSLGALGCAIAGYRRRKLA